MRVICVLAVAFALGVAGCGNLAVGPASPRPNVMLAPDKAPGALVLTPAVQDDFVIPATGSVKDVPVHGWRSTLEAGFKNAYAPPRSGRKLEILGAELSFAPAAVSQYGTAAVVAQIRYKARLVTDSGEEIGAVAGTVKAREANASPSPEGMTDNASKAVEALYETLSADLLSK